MHPAANREGPARTGACHNFRMQSLRTLPRYCLVLALAVVQFWLLTSAEARMAEQGVQTQDICRSPGSSRSGDASPDGAAVSGHHDCSLCCVAAPPASPASLELSHSLPSGLLSIGGTWYQPCAVLTSPPSTGPPR